MATPSKTLSVNATLARAKSHAKKGQLSEAKELYHNVLAAFPQNQQAKKGLKALQKGQVNKKNPSGPPQAQLNSLIALYSQGQTQEALTASEALIKDYPNEPLLYNISGACYKALGQLDAAVKSYEQALSIKPDYVEAHYNLGVTLNDIGQMKAAAKSYEQVLSIKPDYADAHYNLGVTLQELGQMEAAVKSYEQALAIKPDYAEAHNNLGNTLKELAQPEAAVKSYEQALSIKPDYAEAHSNLGNTLKELGQIYAAVKSFEQALAIKPDYVEAHYNLGITFNDLGQLDAAVKSFEQALAIKPDYAEAHNNLGNTLKELGQLDAAVKSFEQALAIKPDYVKAHAQKLHQQSHMCDWCLWPEFNKIKDTLGIKEKSVSTFGLLSLEDAPERHLKRSKNYARETFKQTALPLPCKPKAMPLKLNIGYFSADFHNHATMYLMATLFKYHDRNKFQIFAYSYGPDKKDTMRDALVNGVDFFRNVTGKADQEIVDLTRQDKIDIAIDLKGYTQQTRTSLFAYRLAPIQMNYLGYPGTLGAGFIDYIIADDVVISPEQRQYYSEEIIYLPHSYQVNDHTREISARTLSRTEFGLPEQGFVFCCFNNKYKISPQEFDIWMRLLDNIKGSVLWLLRSNKWAERNLRKEAKKRGINPERLIFADKLSQDEHLARQRLADLFIDTFNYNAHTTASDALWAGLPVVTKQGQGFAARVAASLLTAVGLPELITQTEEEYEALIIDLATDNTQLKTIKNKLAKNRYTHPLFNTELFARHLEEGYTQAYQLYFEAKKPQMIRVKAMETDRLTT
jgi:protein O-GlcNAc transferase